jgi:ADP-heptose:LPS heptosyltransferase
MKVLFITSSRIGDAVLSSGLLDHIARNYPPAKVTIVCGPLAVSLFEGYPNLEQIIPLKKQKHNIHWLKLWWQVSGIKWDLVIDLRNSAVSRLLRAKQRFIFTGGTGHKVEQSAAVMKLDYIPNPKLWFTAEQMRQAKKLIPEGTPVLGVGPASNWRGKTWPVERFIEVIKLWPNHRVAVFAAPGEEAVAYEVLRSIPPERQIDVIAKTDPGTAAAALSLCDFYIGNDSGLMHCAASIGIPTLGLFGPSYDEIYRPWGPKADFISTPESFDQLIDYPGYDSKTAPCLMESLTTEMVKEKIKTMIESLSS